MPLGALLLLAWLILLIRQPKKALPLGGAIVLVLAAIGGTTLLLEQREARRLQQVSVQLELDTHCPAERPLRVEVHNDTRQEAVGLRWLLSAHEPGQYDELLASPMAARQQAPQRLPAGARWQHCLELPALKPGYQPAELEFTATGLRATFD